jgi:hypothetical protein
MTKILPIVTVVLLALLVVARVDRGRAPGETAPAAEREGSASTGTSAAVPNPAISPSRLRAGVPDPAARPPTPELDRLIVLASRQRLAREERYTYIDSMLLSTDSVIRRWGDRNGRAFQVALIDSPDLPGWRPALPTIARRALAAWQEVYPDLRFEVVPDPAAAEITVRWLEKFDLERTGQTDLQYLTSGTIQRAEIQLALLNRDSLPLSEAGLAAVAAHKVGHALGLPHSGNQRDVMYPDTRTGTISARDRATLVLLYAVAPGSLRLVN